MQADIQAWLSTKLSERLKGADVTASSELMNLGVDSLEAANLVFEIEEEYGVQIDPEDIFEYSSVRKLADHILVLVQDLNVTTQE